METTQEGPNCEEGQADRQSQAASQAQQANTHRRLLARCVCVDVTCTSWLEVQLTGTACTKQFWSQVYTLMQRVRTAEECGVLAQLEVFLHLFLLRELLDAVRIELASDDRCGTSAGTLDSPRSDTQSLEQSSCTPSDSSASLPPLPSCSFFCRFLVWAYGDVEARTRYNQLQRLANWFRVSTDVEFFRRLCNGSITPQHKPPAAAAVSQETNKLRQSRLCPLTITYFYLLSPRLPDLQCQFGDGVTPEMEARLISYLSVRPLVLFQQRLATDFGLTKRGSTQSLVIKADQVPSPIFGSAPESAMSVLTDVALDANGDAKVESSLGPEALLASMAKESAEGNPAYARLDAASEDDSMQSESDDDEEEEENEEAASPVSSNSAREASTLPVAAVPRTLRKDKRKRESSPPAAPSSATTRETATTRAPKRSKPRDAAGKVVAGAAAASVPTAPVVIPCLSEAHAVPIELLLLGVSAWIRKRQLSSESATHRHALDGAVVDLMWELSETLCDGDRLLVPEFKQARRSASRAASATYHHSVEGERGCNLLLNVLEKLLQAAPSHSPRSSTS